MAKKKLWMGKESTGTITRFKKSKAGKKLGEYAERAGKKVKASAKKKFKEWRETPAQPARMPPKAAFKRVKPKKLKKFREEGLSMDTGLFAGSSDLFSESSNLYEGSSDLFAGSDIFGTRRRKK